MPEPVIDPATPPVTDPPAPVADPPAPVDPPAPPANEDPAAKIARLEAEVKSARAEAGKSRVDAKAKAAEEARAELAQQVGKALGIIKNDEPTDPAKLVEQVTASQSEARQARVELALFRAADAANADASALLDSRTFLATVADIDPTDTAALTAAITTAVAANPRLGKGAPTGSGMKPNPAQGGSATEAPGLDAQIAAATAKGDTKAAIHLKAAQLIAAS